MIKNALHLPDKWHKVNIVSSLLIVNSQAPAMAREIGAFTFVYCHEVKVNLSSKSEWPSQNSHTAGWVIESLGELTKLFRKKTVDVLICYLCEW